MCSRFFHRGLNKNNRQIGNYKNSNHVVTGQLCPRFLLRGHLKRARVCSRIFHHGLHLNNRQVGNYRNSNHVVTGGGAGCDLAFSFVAHT